MNSEQHISFIFIVGCLRQLSILISVGVATIFFADCLNEIQKKSSDFGFLAITREIFHGIAPNFGDSIILHNFPDTSRCFYYCNVFRSLGTGQCKNVHIIRK